MTILIVIMRLFLQSPLRCLVTAAIVLLCTSGTASLANAERIDPVDWPFGEDYDSLDSLEFPLVNVTLRFQEVVAVDSTTTTSTVAASKAAAAVRNVATTPPTRTAMNQFICGLNALLSDLLQQYWLGWDYIADSVVVSKAVYIDWYLDTQQPNNVTDVLTVHFAAFVTLVPTDPISPRQLQIPADQVMEALMQTVMSLNIQTTDSYFSSMMDATDSLWFGSTKAMRIHFQNLKLQEASSLHTEARMTEALFCDLLLHPCVADSELNATTTPAPEPASETALQLMEALEQQGVTPPAAFQDPTSPQYRATEWLAREMDDAARPWSLEMMMDAQVLQRYALVVLYYATSGDEWTICGQQSVPSCGETPFLSQNVHECDWFMVTCDFATNSIVTGINSRKCG